MSAVALTLVTGLRRVHTCTAGSGAEEHAILIGGHRVLGLLQAPQAAALAAALPSLTQLDAAGLCSFWHDSCLHASLLFALF